MNTTIEPAAGTPLVYQCALPLSRQTLTFIADLLRAHLKKIGSRWRKLPPGKIALIVLATLRHDHRLADLAGGNGVSASTISRWTWGDHRAARRPRAPPRPRPRQDQEGRRGSGAPRRHLNPHPPPFRHRQPRQLQRQAQKHGLLFLALTDESGNLAWISSARRGAASESTAARHDRLADRLRTAGLGALADLGFTGLDPDPADPVIIGGYKATATRKLTLAQRHANQALSAGRAPVEHGFSDLKHWRILTRLRIDPGKATILLRALLVLTRQHTTR